jgi:hypothetical protein
MIERIKIFEATEQKADFQLAVQSIKNQANELINNFQKYQKFKMITTWEEFEALCYRPLGYYDDIIKANIKLPKNSGLQVNISKLCDLYSIDRPGFLTALGLSENDIAEDCPGCKPKPRLKGQGSYLNFEIYQNFAEYLTFDKFQFALNPDPITKKLEAWDYYTTNENQVEYYRQWETLKGCLEYLFKHETFGPSAMEQIIKHLPGLKWVNYNLYMNTEGMRSMIFKIK